jgi:hypothetical protein
VQRQLMTAVAAAAAAAAAAVLVLLLALLLVAADSADCSFAPAYSRAAVSLLRVAADVLAVLLAVWLGLMRHGSRLGCRHAARLSACGATLGMR